ncbi:VIT domain-containing protein [Kiritimatiellaeota bacterium B1221]|nr:VIT domain-containing protein [Kiritimatiellaeota bacterium B1221]
MIESPAHLDRGIGNFFDGTLDRQSHQELESILLTSETARRIFCQSAATQSDLVRALGIADPEIPRVRQPLIFKAGLWAAAAVFIIVCTMSVLLHPSQPFEDMESGNSVSTPAAAGQYRVDEDTALELQKGLWIQISAGSVFSLQHRHPQQRQPIDLRKGTLHIRVASPHPGVTLTTPVGTLQDIGTDFEVEVDDKSNRVFAEVTEGKVAFTPENTPQEIKTLQPGQGRVELSLSYELGHIIDREGNGSLKPITGNRWSVAQIGMPIEAKDWLKTGRRGANALKARLRNGAEIILGPDSLVEIQSATNIRLHRGDIQLKVPEKVQITVQGPEGISWTLENETVVARVSDQDMQKLPTPPGWLTGYLADDSSEALGSLLATVDGRNVPLTMGTHQVTVDIRDQIARTVIEETFINHTSQVLEGVFYFPLPADASISEFGMWIDGELVNGEIVEKQRAREIYETILREKRDPGLLEWNGGNLFKARVYPIVGEKRIKIGYTQVLPKAGNRYSYRYGLQSDLFRQTPLKELSLQVRIHSSDALRQVFSPSHLCRTDQTSHAAQLEYQAEEVVPERDFVLHIETEKDPSPIRVIPHRRGDDGYFMLMLRAPDSGSPRSRDLLPASDPRQWVVMVDSSGSVSGPARKAQLDFLSALLNGMGDQDRVHVMTFDTEARWITESFTGLTPENRIQILDAVEARNPLGWSDLDLAFSELQNRIQGPAEVIVISDGIPTTKNADAQAWIDRFSRMDFEGFTFHAVAPGNLYEASVLKAFSNKGSGSWRGIDGEDPALTANNLLNELTSPTVKNLSIQFEGVEVAAVYPDPLPNLPLGSQQRMVGRYNPSTGPQKGEVLVRGTVDGKALSYTTTFQLDSAEQGNSFIPRLWARSHLDMLVSQGASPEIREQIISLSEEYQIMTPYTSFLVLESDADRERFAVAKKFRMRDGENFFQEGRDSARYALRQQQMLRAKTWRKKLYQQTRQDLNKMGRESLQPEYGHLSSTVAFRSNGDPFGGGGITGGLRFFDGNTNINGLTGYEDYVSLLAANVGFDRIGNETYGIPGSVNEILSDSEVPLPLTQYSGNRQKIGSSTMDLDLRPGREYGAFAKQRRSERSRRIHPGWYMPTLIPDQGAFPSLTLRNAPSLNPSWEPEIRAVLSKLNRRSFFREKNKGFQITLRASSRNPADEWMVQGESELLVQDLHWLSTPLHIPGTGIHREWNIENERGVLDTIWRLGKTQDQINDSLHQFPAPFAGYFGNQLHAMSRMKATLQDEEGLIHIYFTHPSDRNHHREVWVIDPARSLLLERLFLENDTLTGKHLYTDFKQIEGTWWPGRVEYFDAQSQRIRKEQIQLLVENADDMQHRLTRSLKILKNDAVMMESPLPTIFEARDAFNQEDAGLEELWVLLMDAFSRQRSDLAAHYWHEVDTRIQGTRGSDRLQLMFLQNTRQWEAYQRQLMRMARTLQTDPGTVDDARALQMMQFSQSAVTSPRERKEILLALEPVLRRQNHLRHPMQQWYYNMIHACDALGQSDKALDMARILAEESTDHFIHHTQYAQRLKQRGELNRAIAYLKHTLQKYPNGKQSDRQQIHNVLLSFLWQERELDEVIAYVEAQEPEEISSKTYGIYLSALLAKNHVTQAEKWKRARVDAVINGDRSPAAIAAYQAVINQLLGNGYDQRNNGIHVESARALQEIILTLLTEKNTEELIQPIRSSYTFRTSPLVAELRKEMFTQLQKQVETGDPEKIFLLVSWLKESGFEPDGADAWESLLERIFIRWEKSEKTDEHRLESLLLTYGNLELKLKHARIKYQRAETQTAKQQGAQHLVNLLLEKNWSDEVMRAFPLWIEHLDLSRYDAARTTTRKWVDWVIEGRKNHLISQLENRHSLTRRELDKATKTLEQENHLWVLQWLRAQENHPPKAEMKPWIQLDRAYVQARAGSELPALQLEGLRVLEQAITSPPETPSELNEIYIRRWVETLSHLAATTESNEEFADRLLALFEQADRVQAYNFDWKYAIHQLLVALDRGESLESRLQQWYASDKLELQIQWGKNYAMILAECNQVASAVKIFNHLKEENVLEFHDHQTLSDWYTLLDKRDAARQSKRDAWAELPEYAIQSWINQQFNLYSRSQQNHTPQELSPEIIDALYALFRKSASPANYIRMLQNIYKSSRDFRLLAVLVDSTVGQSQQGIYPYIQSMTLILDLLQEEATLDEMTSRIQTLQTRALSATNQRALHLLNFRISVQATQQAQGASPHVDRAFQALQKAFKGEWAEGEQLQMASLLESLGALPPGKLQEEQLQQLYRLRNLVPAGSQDHLTLSQNLARVLWSAHQKEEAVQLLAASLDLRRDANGGTLGNQVIDNVSLLSSYYISLQRFRQAEDLWVKESKRAYTAIKQHEIKQQLYLVYHNTFAQQGRVSLGSGRQLYQNLQKLYINELSGEVDIPMWRSWVQGLCNLWREGHSQNIKTVQKDAERFAISLFPALLQRTAYDEAQLITATLADTLHAIGKTESALSFLIQQAETEPEGIKELRPNVWQSQRYNMARWRVNLGQTLSRSLENRLLNIVLDGLRQELGNQDSHNQSIYWRHSSYYWEEKEAEFTAVALKILEDFPDSESHQLYSTDYLYRGLRQKELATDRLVQAYHRGILSWEGRFKLTEYLEAQKRYAEALRILPGLMAERPDHLDAQTRQIRCLYHKGETGNALNQLVKTDHKFRSENRWQEASAVTLAEVAYAIDQFQKSADYYEEAIAMHVRTQPHRGIGNGTLSTYYEQQARAYQNMGDTGQAVASISGAIIARGPNQNHRRRSLDRLDQIFWNAKDLEAYIHRFEQEVQNTGRDNPILRKALGKFFLRRHQYEQGSLHLRHALDLQPDDPETRELLLDSYTRNKQPGKAIDLLLETVSRNPYDLELYQNLAKRYHQNTQPMESERAYTSMVEALPHESESHEALALVREKQNNWEAALIQWENVIRIRTEEPVGYLGKLRCLIKMNRMPEAQNVWDHINHTPWPKHFGPVKEQAKSLM